MNSRLLSIIGVLTIAAATLESAEIPRTASGRPDLTGTYDVATPDALGAAGKSFGDKTDPDRRRSRSHRQGRSRIHGEDECGVESGSRSAAIRRGRDNRRKGKRRRLQLLLVRPRHPGVQNRRQNGERRSSPIRRNGRKTAADRRGQEARFGARRAPAKEHRGSLVDQGRPKSRPLRRPGNAPLGRALPARVSASTSGPPMFPVLYNNLKKIVQTEDHVMILVEMVHDARIIRMKR